jgi:hypothetical protein
MYENEVEKVDEEIVPLAENLQKDKCNAPQQSLEENKPSSISKVSHQAPFVIFLKPLKPLVITTKITGRHQALLFRFSSYPRVKRLIYCSCMYVH